MRAGLSFADWCLMAPFQRMDYAARVSLYRADVAKQAERADTFGKFVSFVVGKLLGF